MPAHCIGFIPKKMSAPNMSHNSWAKNTARYYGADASSSFCGSQCFIVSPSSVNYTDYTNISLPSLIYVSLVDYYGAVIKSYRDQVKVYANKAISNCAGKVGESLIKHVPRVINKANSEESLFFTLKEGAAVLSNVGVRCLPSGNMSILIDVLLSIPYGINLFKSQRFYRNVLVDFVDCKRGEIFDLNSQTQSSCSRCVDGYSLNDNIDFKSVALKCLPCPPHALKCYDDQVFLSKGTWRPGIQNYHIYDCQSKYACLGGNKTGQQGCNVGHYGPICGICEHNKYFLSSKKICDLCDTRLVSNVLSVVFILIFASLCAYFFYKILHDNLPIL